MRTQEDEQYLRLRQKTWNALDKIGVRSNPAVSDYWIVSWIREKAGVVPVEEWNETGADAFDLFKSNVVRALSDAGVSNPPKRVDAIIEKLEQVLTKKK
jgi:hypothetical protein